MNIVIQGCAHGELDTIYEVIQHMERKENIKVDLLIICGDFQCPRNETDLECMHTPIKYRHIGSFHEYYSGKKVAPVLTLFVHGNHEAINYLKELYFGGWVAPNIYYLGFSNVVNFGGLRIGGISGIYNENDYLKGHFEKPPYSKGYKITSYHVREFEVWKMLNIRSPIDIMISHDWPRGVYRYGDWQTMINKKKHFEQEVMEGTLGSPVNEILLNKLQPKYWFSAHLHYKFSSIVVHPTGYLTRFLALSKCLPNHDFLQLITIPENMCTKPKVLHYDEEWISILRASHKLYPTERNPQRFMDVLDYEKDLEETRAIFNEIGDTIPLNFKITSPPYDGTSKVNRIKMKGAFDHPQTIEFCEKFNIKIDHLINQYQSPNKTQSNDELEKKEIDKNPEEIDLDDFM